MPHTFDLMIQLRTFQINVSAPNRVYDSTLVPFEDIPRSTYRLHIALALLKQLRLIDFDQCTLDPSHPWQFYLKNRTMDTCISNYIVLKNFTQPIPQYIWQSYPLYNC